VPPAVERSTYVLVASLAIVLLMAMWRPLPEVVWHADGAVRVVALAVFWTGWLALRLSGVKRGTMLRKVVVANCGLLVDPAGQKPLPSGVFSLGGSPCLAIAQPSVRPTCQPIEPVEKALAVSITKLRRAVCRARALVCLAP